MKTFLITISLAFCSICNAQDFQSRANDKANFVLPINDKAIPIQWRGAYVSFDAMNRFSDRFSRMNYGVSMNAAFGYKQYNLRLEGFAPFSSEAWVYRIKLEYRFL